MQRFLAPHWGLVAPFSLHAGWELRPAAARAPCPGYCCRAEQVVRDSAELTDEHKVIAEYWADGPGTETPPGHWCLLAQWVSARDHHGLDQDVVLFFALGGALHDAAVAAWDAKRAFDSVRPVGAIRWLFAGDRLCAWGGPGQGTTLIKGEDWQPYLPTPRLPSTSPATRPSAPPPPGYWPATPARTPWAPRSRFRPAVEPGTTPAAT